MKELDKIKKQLKDEQQITKDIKKKVKTYENKIAHDNGIMEEQQNNEVTWGNKPQEVDDQNPKLQLENKDYEDTVNLLRNKLKQMQTQADGLREKQKNVIGKKYIDQ